MSTPSENPFEFPLSRYGAIEHERNQLRAEVEKLKAENATFRNAQMCCESCDDTITTESLRELRADKARLDWLEKAKCAEYREGACGWAINGWNGPFGDTLRQAIDAAMKGAA